MAGNGKPPPRPLWVKVSIVVVLVVIVAIVVMALVGGEHGPGWHLPGGLGLSEPVEQGL
jgi:hypothetical protein